MNKRQAKKLCKKRYHKHYMKQYTFNRNANKDNKAWLESMPYVSCEVFHLIPNPYSKKG